MVGAGDVELLAGIGGGGCAAGAVDWSAASSLPLHADRTAVSNNAPIKERVVM